jgi:hypothetical protein
MSQKYRSAETIISYKDIFQAVVTNLEKHQALGLEFDFVY